jgi:hypothetical protein
MDGTSICTCQRVLAGLWVSGVRIRCRRSERQGFAVGGPPPGFGFWKVSRACVTAIRRKDEHRELWSVVRSMLCGWRGRKLLPGQGTIVVGRFHIPHSGGTPRSQRTVAVSRCGVTGEFSFPPTSQNATHFPSGARAPNRCPLH